MTKNPLLALAAILVWALLLTFVMIPWINAHYQRGPAWFATLCATSAVIWWVLLLWSLHNLAFQLASVVKRSGAPPSAEAIVPPIAILYATCDDYSEGALRSCAAQPAQVYVLDDGRDAERSRSLNALCDELQCTYVTRGDRTGFKAGNLNHALQTVVREPWFLLVDADQQLPVGFLAKLVSTVDLGRHLAFVQAAQRSSDTALLNPFQHALSLDVSLFYTRDLACRPRFGFTPLLGHGALVSRAAWERVGGFAPIVSEDYAFAMSAREAGLVSAFAPGVESAEDLPVDLGGFVIRLRKYAAATAELLRKRALRFLLSENVTATEKWDFLMLTGWYIGLPLVIGNTFLSAFVVYRLYEEGQPYIAPVIPYLYAWMTFCALGIVVSMARSVERGLRFHFWATAVYVACIPVATLALIRGLLRPARFDRTPKNGETTPLRLFDSLFTVTIGLAGIVCAAMWWSPFSPFLLAQSAAFVLFPLLGHLHAATLAGRASRQVVYLPGIFVFWALAEMWRASL